VGEEVEEVVEETAVGWGEEEEEEPVYELVW
jgi:hypothetical protein